MNDPHRGSVHAAHGYIGGSLGNAHARRGAGEDGNAVGGRDARVGGPVPVVQG